MQQCESRVMLYIAAMGDSELLTTWSGIPFYFLEATRAAEHEASGLPLRMGRTLYKSRRIFWTLAEFAAGRGMVGYQYSPSFLRALWRAHNFKPGDIIINM